MLGGMVRGINEQRKMPCVYHVLSLEIGFCMKRGASVGSIPSLYLSYVLEWRAEREVDRGGWNGWMWCLLFFFHLSH
jgi:hypothetical protein